MTENVGDLEFDRSIALYGGPTGSGVAELRLSGALPTWGRIELPSAGIEAGFYYARALAAAHRPSGWWASILLYRVDPTLDATAADKGTSSRAFTQIGEFEAAADVESATRIQGEF